MEYDGNLTYISVAFDNEANRLERERPSGAAGLAS